MRSILLASLMVCLIPLAPTAAQETGRSETLPLGTIDVAHVFKHYKPVEEKLRPLRAAADELGQKVQLRQVEIEQLQRKLIDPKEGDDREKTQEKIARLQTELQRYIQTERSSLQRQELEIQRDVYKLVQAEVKRVARQRGLKLVIVRPRGSLESDDLGEVNRTLNQLVIFEEEGLDLTDEVLKGLQAKAEEEEEGK